MNDSFNLNDLPEVFFIEDAETMEMLADPVRLEIIELLAEPQSVTELAEAMGAPRTRLYHHVNLLHDKDLIQVVATRQSGAVAEKIYWLTARGYQPGEGYLAEANPREQAEAVITAILGTVRADFVRAADEGIVNLAEDSAAKTLFLRRSLTRLSPENLDALIRELEEVLTRYDGLRDPGGIPVGVLSIVHPSSRGA